MTFRSTNLASEDSSLSELLETCFVRSFSCRSFSCLAFSSSTLSFFALPGLTLTLTDSWLLSSLLLSNILSIFSSCRTICFSKLFTLSASLSTLPTAAHSACMTSWLEIVSFCLFIIVQVRPCTQASHSPQTSFSMSEVSVRTVVDTDRKRSSTSRKSSLVDELCL